MFYFIGFGVTERVIGGGLLERVRFFSFNVEVIILIVLWFLVFLFLIILFMFGCIFEFGIRWFRGFLC